MELARFFGVYAKLAPLLLFIILGLIMGRMRVDRQSVANILVFALAPIIFFHTGLKASSGASYFWLPVTAFVTSAILCFLYLMIASVIWRNKARNLMSFAAGSSNSGYFGLAVMTAFFKPELVNLYMFASMGGAICECTLGLYIMKRGDGYSVRHAIYQILKMPMLYGFFAGLALSNANIVMPEIMNDFFHDAQGCYVALGLMLIGISLSGASNLNVNWSFVLVLLSSRVLISPLLAAALIFMDVNFWHFYSLEVHHVMLLLSAMPIAVNTVVFATMFNNHYEEAATSVILGIFAAMILFPFLLFFDPVSTLVLHKSN